MNDSLLQDFIVFKQPLQLKFWVLASVILHYLESLTKIHIFILKLKYFRILVINKFWLFLNRFAKT